MKIPHATEQLSPHATTTESTLQSPPAATSEAHASRAHAPQEKALQWETGALQQRAVRASLTAVREPVHSKKTQHRPKKERDLLLNQSSLGLSGSLSHWPSALAPFPALGSVLNEMVWMSIIFYHLIFGICPLAITPRAFGTQSLHCQLRIITNLQSSGKD